MYAIRSYYGIDLVGQLCGLDRQRYVGTLVAGAHRAVVVAVQAFLELGRDLPALPEIYQPVEAAVAEQARHQGVEISYNFV